ncbi:tetratricopeptide repeat protein [Methanoregula sp.]|uniref:tetratricopeptide repeat protein n=1 Tax=Methanoregula sp. TaxID=2052170 RepID=UPI003C76581F
MKTINGIAVLAAVFIVLLALVIPVSAYSSDAVSWYTQGNDLLQSKNYTQAVTAYDQAILLEPDYYEAWNGEADALNRAAHTADGFNQTGLNAALAASNKSLSISPAYAQGWINRGQILYNIGLLYENQIQDLNTANEYYNDQILAFDQAIEIDPNNDEAWFNKGFALGGMGRYDEAIAAFDKVQTINPEYPRLAYYRNMAVQLRDASTPFYVKYAGIILGSIILCAGIALWFFFLREKPE